MANLQGICRNCGSLMIVDDRDSECECIFCNCVFPTSEALELLANPDGREFPNEKFDKTTEGKHHYTNRVYSTESLEKTVKRQELTAANSTSTSSSNNEFELSPNDVKAPGKVVAIVSASIAALVVVSALIAFPRYNERTKLRENISSGISSVYEGLVDVDSSLNDQGFTKGYMISGQTCETVKLITDDEVDSETAIALFDNYCSLRSSFYSGKNSEVTMTVYSSGNVFIVSNESGSAEIVTN